MGTFDFLYDSTLFICLNERKSPEIGKVFSRNQGEIS